MFFSKTNCKIKDFVVNKVELVKKARTASESTTLPTEVRHLLTELADQLSPKQTLCQPFVHFQLRGTRVQVEILDTVEQLREEVLTRFGFKNEKGAAFTIRVDEDVFVLFSRDLLLIDIVAHEAYHVATEVFDRKFEPDSEEFEEAFAETLAEFVRMFWNHIFGLTEEFHIQFNHQMFTQDFTPTLYPTQVVSVDSPDPLTENPRLVSRAGWTAAKLLATKQSPEVQALCHLTFKVCRALMAADLEAKHAEDRCQQWIKLTEPIFDYGYSKEGKVGLGQSIFQVILERAKKWDEAQRSTDKFSTDKFSTDKLSTDKLSTDK
jgi:hypothetical protein